MKFEGSEAESSIVRAELISDEARIDHALRPESLNDFVGQDRVKDQISTLIRAALSRSSTADHILLAGPPGLGKTTLAMIIASEMGAPIKVTSGPAIHHAGDLASILSSMSPGEVLFIDEIHRIARPAEEMLYMAMEDYRVDVIVGKGAGATSIPLEIAPFTLVGATTRSGLLTGPLRDRFGFTAHMDFYDAEFLAQIIARSSALLGIEIESNAVDEIASRSRGTPRIANRLLRRVRDHAQVHSDGNISIAQAHSALAMYEVDEKGLDRLDRAILVSLIQNFQGGPVGLSTLAISVGEESETLEAVCEPFLIRRGLLSRTPRGRVATRAGWLHVGMRPPAALDSPTLFDDGVN
jgi:Holliday junction DNA helicase RuvB